jgi:hypothetical protein
VHTHTQAHGQLTFPNTFPVFPPILLAISPQAVLQHPRLQKRHHLPSA